MAEGGLADGMCRLAGEAFGLALDSVEPSRDAESGGQRAAALRVACASIVEAGSETCRLVAITVVAGTAADSQISPDLIQEGAGGVDFRSLYKAAVRPVLIETATRLSARWHPSDDPFVSNPFREGKIDDAWLARRKNKLPGAEALLAIVTHVAATPALAGLALQELASHEVKRLARSKLIYRIPPRMTTAIVAATMQEWLLGGTLGRRLEIAAVSLLRFTGARLASAWDRVESHHVNDPRPHDALCLRGEVIIAVAEAKDQPVTLSHIRQLSDEMARYDAARGYLFTREEWWPLHADTETDAISAYIVDRSVIGLRIDVVDVMEAARVWLALVDQTESALPDFMRTLTAELDEHGLLEDRRALAALLNRL